MVLSASVKSHVDQLVEDGGPLRELVEQSGLEVVIDDMICRDSRLANEHGVDLTQVECTHEEWLLREDLKKLFKGEKIGIDESSAFLGVHPGMSSLANVGYYSYKVGFKPEKIAGFLGAPCLPAVVQESQLVEECQRITFSRDVFPKDRNQAKQQLEEFRLREWHMKAKQSVTRQLMDKSRSDNPITLEATCPFGALGRLKPVRLVCEQNGVMLDTKFAPADLLKPLNTQTNQVDLRNQVELKDYLVEQFPDFFESSPYKPHELLPDAKKWFALSDKEQAAVAVSILNNETFDSVWDRSVPGFIKLGLQGVWVVYDPACGKEADVQSRKLHSLEVLFCHPFSWGFFHLQKAMDYLLQHDFPSYVFIKKFELQAVANIVAKPEYSALPRLRVNWRMADFRAADLRGLMHQLLTKYSHRIGSEYTEYWMEKCIMEGGYDLGEVAEVVEKESPTGPENVNDEAKRRKIS